jgi:tetratricopeptide (TPR) repeat protein
MVVFQPAMTLAIRRVAAVLLASVFLPCLGSAADPWLKLKSAHFELYTTAGEKKGREAILYFEQVRDFFGKARQGAKPATNAPVRIIAFHSDKEFQPYRINEFATAFYLDGYDRDYIVMRNISQENYPVAVHEFTHLLVKHSGADVPIWLNEGLAELYSTLKPLGNKVVVGQVIPGRYYYLQQHKWLSLETLLGVDHHSSYYNERDRAGIFYSESWALTHMLNLSPAYRPQFSKFLAALAAGVPASEAFWLAYAKTVDQVQGDLEQYMHGSHFNAAVFGVKLEKSAEEPYIEPASRLDSGAMLADVLAFTGKKEAAKEAYERLAKDYPTSWEVEAGRAELAWRSKDLEEARKHFARAAELGSTNPRLYFDFARVLGGTPEKEIAAIPLLKKAVEMDPDYQEAHHYLAFCLLQDGEYQEAINHFGKVKNVKPEQASAFYHGIAYGEYHLEKWDEARKAAELARKYARKPQEIGAAEDMLRTLSEEKESRVAPAAPNRNAERFVPAAPSVPSKPSVLGRLRQVDCLGKIVRLQVTAGDNQILLAIMDPGRVAIKGSPTGDVNLACGPQKGKLVVVEYDSRQDAKLGTVGDVLSIEFQ